jgi:hypothetical protein
MINIERAYCRLVSYNKFNKMSDKLVKELHLVKGGDTDLLDLLDNLEEICEKYNLVFEINRGAYSRDNNLGAEINEISIYTKTETGRILNTEVVITIEESMKKSDAKDVFSTIKGFIESEDDEY